MLFHLSILNVNRFYTDLIRSTYEIGTTIRPEDLDWSSNSRDTTQCIDKVRTEGEIRLNGFWIIGAKRLISTLIRTCVLCRKLRGKVEVQKMTDLPEDMATTR
jgi:hypothetical protein